MHQKYIPEHASHSTQQSTIGTAYKISDFPCFTDKPHFRIIKTTPSARASYSPEIQPIISRYLSAMKGKTAPYFPPAHTAQNSWKDHSL